MVERERQRLRRVKIRAGDAIFLPSIGAGAALPLLNYTCRWTSAGLCSLSPPTTRDRESAAAEIFFSPSSSSTVGNLLTDACFGKQLLYIAFCGFLLLF